MKEYRAQNNGGNMKFIVILHEQSPSLRVKTILLA